MKTKVTTLDNKASGEVTLSKEIFGADVRKDIIQRVIKWQLAKRQAGTHKVKGMSEVSGTGKKPFRQKGTGGARQGSKRAVQMRGGANAFGPQVRSHAHSLPKSIRRLGLISILSAKQKEGKLHILKEAVVAKPSTADLAKKIKDLGWKNALVIDGKEVNENFKKAAANIKHIDVLPSVGANVYDIVKHDTLVLTEAAVQGLQERLA